MTLPSFSLGLVVATAVGHEVALGARHERQVGLRAVARRAGGGGVVVVGGVLDLERVHPVALDVVRLEPVASVDLAVAVDVEVVAHPQGEALDVERGDALVHQGRVGAVGHDVVGRRRPPRAVGTVADVAQRQAVAELVADQVEEREEVAEAGDRVDGAVDGDADVATDAAAVLHVDAAGLTAVLLEALDAPARRPC